MATPRDLIVFSHLRWDFVWQRPQHLISRLARSRRVFFVEEPIRDETGPDRWEIAEPISGLHVCRPRTMHDAPGFHDGQYEPLGRLIERLVAEKGIGEHDAWFYTPMAFPLARHLDPSVVVYDCMDELSAFLHAPKELLERERLLFERADVVFTGGPSLHRAKKDRHANAHCFSSSVDAAHFAKAKGDIAEPAEQAPLPHPRLGFFGVIDERLDIPLLDAAAALRPDWQFVLVGPVVKIDPDTLPRRANIHYMGQRPYAELPAFLSGWDVCLLPFALNDATKYISPTKTLEYMAAERPIVSTPITDVAEPYGDIVAIVERAEELVEACDKALAMGDAERNDMITRMRGVLARTSWDSTAAAMVKRIEDAAGKRAARNATASADGGSTSIPVAVIGAGPTGLSAAYHLGEDAMVIEANDTVGGWCRSIERDGFTFDYAGHIMFSNDSYVHEMYRTLLGDNVHWQDREAWIYSKNVYTRYPFQGSLYGLPPDVIRECIVGAVESRFGSLKPPKADPAPKTATNGHANGSARLSAKDRNDGNGRHDGNGKTDAKHHTNGNGAAKAHKNGKTDSWCEPGSVEDCCGDGVMESTAPLGHANGKGGPSSSEPRNFEEFIYKVWGAGIARHFAIPYNRKLWAVPLSEMETSWLGGRVPIPDLEEMIEGALSPSPKPMGPNARFGYPLRGGFQALMDGFLPLLKGPLRLSTKVVGFSPLKHELTLSDGSVVNYESLISTMPLPTLVRLAGDEAPDEVRRAAQGLRFISVRCVHLGIGRENLTEKHWIYYPEDTVFHRIFVQGNASPHCNPSGGFGLTCEITHHPKYKPLAEDGDALIERCVADCRKVGIIGPDDPVLTACQVEMPHAYVVYDHARPKNVATIREWLEQHDVVLAGRYSEWEYYNSDHAFLAGKKAAERVRTTRLESADVAG